MFLSFTVDLKNALTSLDRLGYVQWVLVYREFDYRDPRNTGIFLMVTINLEYRDFPGFSRIFPDFPGKI